MLEWWLTLDGVELANSARLDAYLRNTVDPASVEVVQTCGCPTLVPALAGDPDREEYTTPQDDPAPWYDPTIPQSADFLGLLVQDAAGLDTRQVTRTVTPGVTGASLSRAREQPLTITVTAVVVATSCCGADYGLAWLSEVLAGRAPDRCDGVDLDLIACCPPADMTPGDARGRLLRTVRRVAVVDGPHVIDRVGDGCQTDGDCAAGADAITVEFTLTAAVPWRWTRPVPVLFSGWPIDPSADCVQWCVHDQDVGCDSCRLASCDQPGHVCADPHCSSPAPPGPPPARTCHCVPIAAVVEAWEIDLEDRPDWFLTVPMITVEAGSEALRRASISFYRRRSPDHDGMSCVEVAEAQRCDPHAVFHIGFLPAGAVLELDGQVGRTTVTCDGVTQSATEVWGHGGGPVQFPPMDSGQWCVLLETDALIPPASDARLFISVSGREY